MTKTTSEAPQSGERAPDALRDDEDLRLAQVARRLAEAAQAVENHDGGRVGVDYQRKVEAWQAAYADLRRVAQSGEGA